MRGAATALLLALVPTLAAACSDDGDGSTAKPVTTTTAAGTTTTATPGESTCPLADASTARQTATRSGSGTALLVAVRTGAHECFDRVAFEFRPGASPDVTAEYRSGPFMLGQSDQPVTVAGAAFLVVRFEPAAGVDLSDPAAPLTYTGPSSLTPSGFAHVREVRRIEDFEGVMVWVLGLDAQRPFRLGTLDGPPRVYLDVG